MDTRQREARVSAQEISDRAQFAVHVANRALVARGWSHPCYVPGREALDSVMLHLVRAKWLLGAATGTYAGYIAEAGSPDDLDAALDTFEYVAQRADEIRLAMERGDAPAPASRSDPELSRNSSEVLYADGIPVVPGSSPVVVLQGSNRDMGRQYAHQILEIFGSFILGWHGKRTMSVKDMAELRKWEAELERYTPDVLDFARGLCDGANSRGMSLSYDQAVAIFTGVWPPMTEVKPMALAQSSEADEDVVAATYLGTGQAGPTDPPEPCSGAFGWNEATTDGALIAAASQDQDATFQVTIVAYPSTGNNFVLTPFAANGTIPVLGQHYFSGHPGMNSKGVAYVHHGGANTGEPREEWGYGVRRGPAVMHMLQYCNSAKEARDFMLSLPVGDTASTLGTVGGMFGDREYGFSLEARPGSPGDPNPIIREGTIDDSGRTLEVLYATNNALAPESAHLNAAPTSGKGYDYSREGGWFTRDPDVISSGTKGEAIRRGMTASAEERARFLYGRLVEGYGKLDLEYVTRLYRTGEADVHDEDGVNAMSNTSAAHRGNAFVAVFSPDDGSAGTYRACVGPADRALGARGVGHGYYYYDETAAFWELTLADSPTSVLDDALEVAKARLRRADDVIADLADDFGGKVKLVEWVTEARRLLTSAQNSADVDGQGCEGQLDDQLAALSRALRQAHWAQIRAEQVFEAVHPPVGLS